MFACETVIVKKWFFWLCILLKALDRAIKITTNIADSQKPKIFCFCQFLQMFIGNITGAIGIPEDAME